MSSRLRASAPYDDSEDVGEVYRLSYTSLIILLLAFFIFLVSLTSSDELKASSVRESLDAKFHAQHQKEVEDARQIIALAESQHFSVFKGKDHILLTLPGAGVFESASEIIKPEMLPALTKIAELVRILELSAVIEGHTDSIPIVSGRFPSNWELSAARAVSVLRLFLDNGVPSSRIAAAGRGEFLPVAGNDSEEGRARNRRVTIRLMSLPLKAQE